VKGKLEPELIFAICDFRPYLITITLFFTVNIRSWILLGEKSVERIIIEIQDTACTAKMEI